MKMPPHGRAEAEQAERDQQRAVGEDNPVRHVLECARANTGAEDQQSGAHPCRIGALRRQDVARSAASTVVRSALPSIRAEEFLSSRAVSATLRVCCSTDFAVCLTAVSADFGEAVLAIQPIQSIVRRRGGQTASSIVKPTFSVT